MNIKFIQQYDSLRFLLLGLILTTLSACGASVPSPELYNRIISHNESFKGKMDLKKLLATTQLNEPLTQGSLGRTLTLGTDGKHTLNPPPACASLIPDRVREDYRDRLTAVFDDYLLTTIKPAQTQVDFKKMPYSVNIANEVQAGSVISAKVGIARVLGFVDERELKDFDRCCQLTGSCGQHMIHKLYEVDQDLRFISKEQPLLQKTLLNFEQGLKTDIKTAKLGKLARLVYKTQAEAEKKRAEQGISHFEHRAIPKPLPSPFKDAKISVSPSVSKIKCKPKKSKEAGVIEFVIKLEGSEGAQESFGYKIETSKDWVDLSLAERKRGVKVGTGTIVCYPGPDAFTSPDDRCPSTLILNAFPPACDSMKGDGNFKWQAYFGVYGPGDDQNRAHHFTKSNLIITKVNK